MTVMSCNIRYSGADDGSNNWTFRRELCLKTILSRRPDVVCFQEMHADQFDWLSARMDRFAFVAPTDVPAGTNPVNSVFYRVDRLALKSAGAYWLSRTPHVPGSKSWGSDCIRMATWARLAGASGQELGELRVVNTHLDHISQRARVHQASMIAEDCLAYPAGYPQVVTGDFNCDRRNPAVAALLRAGFRDTYEAVHGPCDPYPTFHAFRGRAFHSRIGKMDWVMVKGNLAVRDAEIVTDNEEGRYPSDHFFVTADIAPAGGR